MKIIVGQENGSPRLDQYLFQQKLGPSRSQISQWIKKCFVLVNGEPAKPSTHLDSADVITLNLPEFPEPSHLLPEQMPLDIIYEDDDLLVLNKSANMVVHPGAGHATGTLTQALLAHCGTLSTIGGVVRPGLVHRLDKDTSGVMVVAKNDATHLELSRQFKAHEVEKIYSALVFGEIKKNSGRIETFIGRSPKHRQRQAVLANSGRVAITHYQVLQRAHGLSHLRIQLETGRTHQIRVHLTHLGHSLVGDRLYGGHAKRVKAQQSQAIREALQKIERTLLHATELSFTHPKQKKPLHFEAPLPKDFCEILKLCFAPLG